jgi:hypothetical protein
MQHRKVTMIQALAGNDFTYQSGDVVELPIAVAEIWTSRGLAEYEDEAEGDKPSAPPAFRAQKGTSKKKIEKR